MQVQALARRDQQLHFGRMGEDIGQHTRRLEHLLEVVQYQQHLFVAQVIQKLGALVLRPVEGRLERVDDGRDQQVGRGDRRQLDGVHTLLEGVDLLGSDLQRQARLADAARPDQRQQAAVRIGQQFGDAGALVLAAHERRGLGRQVVRARGQRAQRREFLDGQIGMRQGVDALGVVQILEQVHAQVLQRRLGGQGVKIDHRRGQQDLPAPARVHHARRAVEDRAEVFFLLADGPTLEDAPLGLPGVERQPDAQRGDGPPVLEGELALDGDGAFERPAVLEHGGDAVAPVAEDAPAVLPDQTLQDGVMARDSAAHGILVFFPQPG